MIGKLKEKLLQGNSKHSKVAKSCDSIIWETECEKCSKTFCKIFGRKYMQNKKNTKYFNNPNV